MTISNSIPYRFYDVSTGASFNDTLIDGVYSPCFFQVTSAGDFLGVQVSADSQPTFKLFDEDGNELFSDVMANTSGSYYTYNYPVDGIINNYPNVMRFYISLQQSGVEIVRSEGIEITDNTTVKIRYSNNTDFDGIYYGGGLVNFTIRIKAQFWKESFPKEFENYAKSNGTFTRVYDQRLTKKLLETDYMPAYMHDKLTRILMHDNIEIDGEKWLQQDEYENEKINKYALSRASVLLTKKEEIIKNIL